MSNQVPPPVPFGDPDQTRRENNTAVKKGLLFGCGGCAMIVALLFLVGGAIVFYIFSSVRSSEPFQHTLQAAQASPEMCQALGEPITLGWWFTGSVNWHNGDGTAAVRIPLSGPRDSATVEVSGALTAGGPWSFDKMEATLKSTGQVIDLRQP